MPFSFLQRSSLPELARQLTLASYYPSLALQDLLTGVDNVRHDVVLSPRFCDLARTHICRLIARYGQVEDIALEEPAAVRPQAVAQSRILMAGPAPGKPTGPPVPRAYDPTDFKRLLAELHTASLNAAKAQGNISVDLLARLAVLKFLRSELGLQFNQILERCRARFRSADLRSPSPKSLELRERFARLQVSKKTVLRRAGQELFTTLREVEKETLARQRRSLFADAGAPQYELLVNRLLLTEDGRDDFLNAEQYVMVGNFDRDPDRSRALFDIAAQFLRSLELPAAGADVSGMLNVPENAHELTAGAAPDENTPKGKAQKAVLQAWQGALEDAGVMEHGIAAYEVVPLLAQYCPPVNPQQLKNALIDRAERKRVETLLEEHGKLSPQALHAAVARVEGCRGADRLKLAARLLADLLRYHRDLERMRAVLEALDAVNVVGNEKLRELSAINNTLYEFLLPEEQKPTEDRVCGHVIIKADVRDSTQLTRTLVERGLNPASYFSLNFFDPINKLLPKYQATKVFIEGDAVILALFERDGEPSFAVARACALAREMTEIVRGYNQESERAGLPILELGLGICYQNSAPMYLMDGAARIMISPALNESDRLSGCAKGARHFLRNRDCLFNVFAFKTVEDADTAGNPDEFLMRFNVSGVHINRAAFLRLQQEIALQPRELELPMLWGPERVRLYSGMVPVAAGVFHKLVLREARVAHIDARDFTLKRWTDAPYYEICTNQKVAELVERSAAAVAAQKG